MEQIPNDSWLSLLMGDCCREIYEILHQDVRRGRGKNLQKEVTAETSKVRDLFKERALLYYKKAAHLGHAEAHKSYGLFLISLKRDEEAEESLLTAVEMCVERGVPVDEISWSNLVSLLERKGDKDMASKLRSKSDHPSSSVREGSLDESKKGNIMLGKTRTRATRARSRSDPLQGFIDKVDTKPSEATTPKPRAGDRTPPVPRLREGIRLGQIKSKFRKTPHSSVPQSPVFPSQKAEQFFTGKRSPRAGGGGEEEEGAGGSRSPGMTFPSQKAEKFFTGKSSLRSVEREDGVSLRRASEMTHHSADLRVSPRAAIYSEGADSSSSIIEEDDEDLLEAVSDALERNRWLMENMQKYGSSFDSPRVLK